MKITDHIYFYPNKDIKGYVTPSNTTIIIGNTKQVMIDPGINIQKRLNCLLRETKKDNIDIKKTNEIWLTHAHHDHFQMIYNLFKIFGENRLVRCHSLGKSILGTANLKENFITREKRKAGPFWPMLLTLDDRKRITENTVLSVLNMIREGISVLWRKVTNVEPFVDGEIVKISPVEIQIMYLPGHAIDEIGFHIAQEKTLILGDLINIYKSRDNKDCCKLILYNFHSDINKAHESLKKMKQIQQPEILLTCHSDPVNGKENIKEIFDELISRINKYQTMAKEFIQTHQTLKGIKLIKKFAKILPDDNLLLVEKRFIALAVLKSLGEA